MRLRLLVCTAAACALLYATVSPGVAADLVVLLCDRDTSGFELDLKAGQLTPKNYDTTASPGFTLLEPIRDGTMVLLSATHMRIRTVE